MMQSDWDEYEAWDAAGAPGEETGTWKAWEDIDINDVMFGIPDE